MTVIMTSVVLASCNVTRTITNESQYYQRGDTSVIIQTKTIETYDASRLTMHRVGNKIARVHTTPLRRKRQSMIKLPCNKCNGCVSSSSHRLKSAGALIKERATYASEVLCVACNTRSAIRGTSSPAKIRNFRGPQLN